MVDRRPHAVYRRLMVSHGHGYPFWVPEIDQSLPLTYRQSGMKQGDLIILNDNGGYSYLFNIEARAEDPVNINRVPPHFEPLQISPTEFPPSIYPLFHNKRSAVTACDEFTRSFDIEASAELPTLAGGGVSFGISTSKTEEAILMLPDGATRYDTSNERIYEEYAEKYAESWFDFVENILGKRLPTSSLYLVTGCDKSPSWGAAVIHNPTKSRHCSLNFTVGGIAGGGISYSTSSKKQRGPNMRSFPPTGFSPSALVEENQCVFARGLTIALKKSFMKRKVSGVEISLINGSSNDTCPSFRSNSSNSSRSSDGSSSSSSWFSRLGSGSSSTSSRQTSSNGHSDIEGLSTSSYSEHTPDIASSDPGMNAEWSWNPSTYLSQRMLSESPNASISIVSDRQWTSYVRDTPEWTVDSIFDHVAARRELAIVNGIATFVYQDSILVESSTTSKPASPIIVSESDHKDSGNSKGLAHSIQSSFAYPLSDIDARPTPDDESFSTREVKGDPKEHEGTSGSHTQLQVDVQNMSLVKRRKAFLPTDPFLLQPRARKQRTLSQTTVKGSPSPSTYLSTLPDKMLSEDASSFADNPKTQHMHNDKYTTFEDLTVSDPLSRDSTDPSSVQWVWQQLHDRLSPGISAESTQNTSDPRARILHLAHGRSQTQDLFDAIHALRSFTQTDWTNFDKYTPTINSLDDILSATRLAHLDMTPVAHNDYKRAIDNQHRGDKLMVFSAS